MTRAFFYAACVYALLNFIPAAFAETIPATFGNWKLQVGGNPGVHPTIEGACKSYTPPGYVFEYYVLDSPNSATCYDKNTEGENYITYTALATYVCPPDYTINHGTTVTCTGDKTPEPCPASGTLISSGIFKFPGGASNGQFCSAGCPVSFGGTFPTHADADGGLYGTGEMVYTGGNVGDCTGDSMPSSGGSPDPVEPQPPEGCDTGNTITIGDKTYCMPGAKPGDGGGDNGGNNGGNNGGDNGGNNGGDNGGNNGGDNGGNNGGNTPGDGSGGGETPGDGSGDEGDDEKDDRNASGGCESFSCSGDAIDCSIAQAAWKAACHPEKRKLTDAPDCASAPQCEGDAIDCAIVKTAWKNYCQLEWMEKENEFSDEYNKAKGEMDNPEKFVTENTDTVFNLQTHVSAANACPAAISIPVFGETIEAPTDWICGYLGVIAIVLKVLAWLFVGRMVLGAF